MEDDVIELLKLQGDALSKFRNAIDETRAEGKRRADDIEAKMNRLALGVGGTPPGPADGKLTPEAKAEFKALDKFIRTGDASEFKAMSVGSDVDGGYTVTPHFSEDMTERLFDQSPMRQLARVEVMTTGDTFVEIDDRGEASATWVGEKQARAAGATPQFGAWEIPVREIYSLQPVTQRLLDDSSRNLGEWITNKITDKFSRTEGSAFVLGDGVLRPRGFLTYPTNTDKDFGRARGSLQYIKTGADGTFGASTNGADKLRDLVWSLRAPYRKGAVWMMNSNTASNVDKMKDGQGNFIWRQGVSTGEPNSLLGYPVEINEDMPDMATGAFPIAFGNFKLGYCIVDKAGVKLIQDPFTDKPNVLFYAYKRVGGGMTNDDAIKLLQTSA